MQRHIHRSREDILISFQLNVYILIVNYKNADTRGMHRRFL